MTDRTREISEQVARITAENARLLDRLIETEKRFRRISRGVLRVQEEERGKISRDLHDGIGQSLTALKIQLELMEQEAGAAQTALAPRLAAVRELAESCLAEVREMARLLRPQMLDDLGLAPTLSWLARTVEERTGVAVALDVSVGEAVDPDAETLVFRLVQESLTNIVKHAGVREARVAVKASPRSILLTVADGGRGFDAAAVLAGTEEERGFGVRAMRDRVHSFNGRFQIESSEKGTVLEAEIPIEARA
ncbi:MAG TPA: sensor histidine kinase [Thermoanaerobaculia bacterium]|jgi:signal transduction histidine kinase|nr:sensor histidine kinase [Thermoanaerobaculia bacterium]